MKKVLFLIFSFCILIKVVSATDDLSPNSKSAILIEQTTGQVLFSQNPDEKLPIASVTKIMTLLLTMEALEKGTIKM